MNEIVERIMDIDKWPDIELPENLEILNELADKSYNEHTLNGLLAATLMYHQIIEAMCLHLIDNCHFFIQLSVYPSTINYTVPSNRMLGAYIKELQDSVSFDHKEDFLERVQAFNSIRNEAIHKLRKTNIEQVIQDLVTVKSLFDAIYSLYDEIQDDFRCTFHSVKKDVFIDVVDCDDIGLSE